MLKLIQIIHFANKYLNNSAPQGTKEMKYAFQGKIQIADDFFPYFEGLWSSWL